MTRRPLQIAADHPAYAGHFPGNPVLPGVVLIDAALHALEPAGTRVRPGGSPTPGGWQVAAAKFPSPARPGEALVLEYDSLANGSIRFAIRAGERTVAQGLLIPPRPETGAARGDQS